MALHFLTSSNETIDVVVTCDSSVEAPEDQRNAYLNSGSLDDLGTVQEDATKFTLKALSPSEREEAEVRAGAYTRSELGRLLWVEAPSETFNLVRTTPSAYSTNSSVKVKEAGAEIVNGFAKFVSGIVGAAPCVAKV